MFLERELALAEQLVRHAGSLAQTLRHKLSIMYKPQGQGPVTNADVAIDNFITEQLATHFANDRIISEEGCPPNCLPIEMGRAWFVDPIDGTASYIQGNDDYVVMIGLAIDGIARMGVVYQPSSDRLWRGVYDPLGHDNFADVTEQGQSKRLAIESAPPPAMLTLIASRTRKSVRQTEMINRLTPAHIVYKSSIGLKAMVIAEGGADFYIAWSNRIAMWDTCAPAALLTAACGHASLVDGQPLRYLGGINHRQPVLMAHFQPGRDFLRTLTDIARL